VERLKILITGIGIVGKSTFRRALKPFLSEILSRIKPIRLVVDIDGDYDEMPNNFDKETLYIIEDVHGPTPKACLPIQDYDLIFYLLPTFLSHLTFWLKRITKWFENGEGGWDKETKSRVGNGHSHSLLNLPIFFKLLIRDLKNRRKWIKEDKEALLPFSEKTTFVYPQWKDKKIRFNLF